MTYQSHSDSHIGGEVATMHLCTFVSEEHGKGRLRARKKQTSKGGGEIWNRDVDFCFFQKRNGDALARYLAVVAYRHCALGQSFLIELPPHRTPFQSTLTYAYPHYSMDLLFPSR